MSFLQANLQALEGRFPGISQDLREKTLAGGEPLVVEKARSGDWTARVGQVRLYSSFDPGKDVERSLAPVDDDTDFAVIGGFGLGYHLEALGQRYPDLPLLVCEPLAQRFLQALEVRDLTQTLGSPWVSFLIGERAQAAAQFLETFACRKIAYLPLRPLFDLHTPWFLDLEHTLHDFQAKCRVNDQTLGRFFPLWLRNHSKNLKRWDSLAPLAGLENTFPGSPAVVCAAGPSLATSLDWIAEHRHQVVLIAVDTAWNALRLAGLTPDFLVFMDGQYWNSRHVDSPIPPQTRVVAELISHPRALRCAPGRTFISHSSVPFLAAWEEAHLGPLGRLKSGGSVATSAWELALFLGCSQVFFAGLDLGYPRGQTHVKGSQFEEALHRLSHRLCPGESRGYRLLNDVGLVPRPSVDGKTVLSDVRMDLYRSWLEASFAAHPGVEVYNLSPWGSRIPGARALAGGPVTWKEKKEKEPSPPPPPVQGKEHRLPAPALMEEGCRLIHQALSGSIADNSQFQKELGELQRKAERMWGTETWRILAYQAENSYRHFPSKRSLAALERTWNLGLNIAQCWEKEQKRRFRG